MKILFLPKYSKMGGSSRMRSFQYMPYLEKEGHNITTSSFFDDVYLKSYYSGKRNILAILRAYIKRSFILFTAFRYDGLIVEKELFPYLPAFAEFFLQKVGVKYFVDYDDAIFHNYNRSKNLIIKFLMSNKIKKVMRYSTQVIVGNEYLANYARLAGVNRVIIIPTVIDLERYKPKEIVNQSKFVVGWIGTKSTFEKCLLPCRNWIKALQNEDNDITFHIIGINNGPNLGKNVKYIPWSENTEVKEIAKMDVGLMPLEDSPWERGKCAYKLIQYAASGIPLLASDVGMNKDICIDGKTGFCIQQNNWKEKILELKANENLRQNMGKAGRALIEEKYCIQITAPIWNKIIKEYF